MPIALVIVSVLFAAVDTGDVGNTVQVVGTAAGLIWLLVTVGRDLGMGVSTGRRRRVPDPPRASDDARAGAGGDRQPPVSPS